MNFRKIRVYEHAKNNYFKRVLKENPDNTSLGERIRAEERIKEAVKSPDRISNTRPNEPPIHIRGDIAVVVGVPGDENGIYKPYDRDTQEVVIPTTYNSKTFGGPAVNKSRESS